MPSVKRPPSEDFAADVIAGVKYLRARADIDPKRIGLIGHSEGGLIAPMVATRSRDVAFIVLLAGPGVPGEQILYAQGEAISRSMGGRGGKGPLVVPLQAARLEIR